MLENKDSNKGTNPPEKAGIMTTNKKNWKSYFKDFFMLFLAVFCGFLAENYRESLSAQKIEKEYMVSLIASNAIAVAGSRAQISAHDASRRATRIR